MSATLTMYGRQQLLNAFWTPDDFVLRELSTMRLCLDVPPSNANLAQLVEPDVADGYVPVNYLMGSGFWTATGFSEIFNSQPMVFPHCNDDWGLIQGWAILDSATDHCLAVGGFNTPFFAAAGMDPVIEVAGITLGLYD